jgi:hypothetical protein
MSTLTIIRRVATYTQQLRKIMCALNRMPFVQQFQTTFRGIMLRKSYRLLAMLLLVALPVCVILTFAVRAYLPQEGEPLPLTGVELITVKEHGFEPRQITRRQGLFLFAVDNRSGLEAISLRLEKADGSLVRQMDIHASNPDRRDVLNLPAGDYVLTEAGNPQWLCQITVTPN